MPIAITDYSWTETLTEVNISVPLKAVKASKVDIFSTDDYIKVNFPPFVCELALFRPVEDDKSVAKIGEGMIRFHLLKKEPGFWSCLCSKDIKDKGLMQERRDLAIKKAQEKAKSVEKAKAAEKQEKAKKALKEQMRLEEQERKRIQDLKEKEIKDASDEIDKWKEQQSKPKEVEEGDTCYQAPRSRGEISVSFTERVFPTPLRESKVAEEEAWLKKQAEARKRENVDDPDLNLEEKDPVWLKEKADGFYKSGNFLSAINAYSLAIRISPKMHSLYSNRAACHLKLGNLMKCIEDSSRALELLTPPVPANAVSRLKAHVRRGTAFCNLELYCEGLQDYEEASKLAPDNEDLKADILKIRKVIQGEAPT